MLKTEKGIRDVDPLFPVKTDFRCILISLHFSKLLHISINFIT